MKYGLWIIFLFGQAPGIRAQSLSIPVLDTVLNLSADSAAGYLKAHDYFLVEKKKESQTASYYFTSLEKGNDGLAWVRSLTLLDASSGSYTGRLISYRTYQQEEYESILHYFLNNGFSTRETYHMGSEWHTLYRKGDREYRLKQSLETLPGGKQVKAYELEFGG